MRTSFDNCDMYRYHYQIGKNEYMTYSGSLTSPDDDGFSKNILVERLKDGTWKLYNMWDDPQHGMAFKTEEEVMDNLGESCKALSDKYGISVGLPWAKESPKPDDLEHYMWSDRFIHRNSETTVRSYSQETDEDWFNVTVVHDLVPRSSYLVKVKCGSKRAGLMDSRKFKAMVEKASDAEDFMLWALDEGSSWYNTRFIVPELYSPWIQSVESKAIMTENDVFNMHIAPSDKGYILDIRRCEDDVLVMTLSDIATEREAMSLAREWMEWASCLSDDPTTEVFTGLESMRKYPTVMG